MPETTCNASWNAGITHQYLGYRSASHKGQRIRACTGIVDKELCPLPPARVHGQY